MFKDVMLDDGDATLSRSVNAKSYSREIKSCAFNRKKAF